MKSSSRIYATVSDLDGNFLTAYWPVRKVEVKPGKITLRYHATNSVTWDTTKFRVALEAQTWHGPLPVDRFSSRRAA